MNVIVDGLVPAVRRPRCVSFSAALAANASPNSLEQPSPLGIRLQKRPNSLLDPLIPGRSLQSLDIRRRHALTRRARGEGRKVQGVGHDDGYDVVLKRIGVDVNLGDAAREEQKGQRALQERREREGGTDRGQRL